MIYTQSYGLQRESEYTGTPPNNLPLTGNFIIVSWWYSRIFFKSEPGPSSWLTRQHFALVSQLLSAELDIAYSLSLISMLNKNFSHQKLFSITETNLKKKKQEKTWSLAGDVRIAFQSVLFVLKKKTLLFHMPYFQECFQSNHSS